MATPEGAVKKAVVQVLKKYKVWHFFPMSGGFGKSGVPDIIGIVSGIFVGVECKADESKPLTALQQLRRREIIGAGGMFFTVCDGVTLQLLEGFIMGATAERLSYEVQGNLLVVSDKKGNKVDLPVVSSLLNELHFRGLQLVLQTATAGIGGDKLNSVVDTYNKIVEQGAVPKNPGKATGAFRYLEKVAAYASLHGYSTQAVKEALGKLSPDVVTTVLNSPEVLERAARLQTSEVKIEV